MTYITHKDEPHWVKGLKNKHKNDILYKSIFFFLFIVFLSLLTIPLITPNFIYIDLVMNIILIGLLITFPFFLKFNFNYLNIDCLAYFLYKVGNDLNNFPDFDSDSDYYFKTNRNFLKKAMKIINQYKTHKKNVFSNNISQFFHKLEQMCLRLNFLYSNECDHTTYAETKRKLSYEIIKLSELINKEQSYLSSAYIETITSILQTLLGVPEKSFESQTTHINISQPYFLKVIEFSVIAFVLIFFGTIKFVEYFLKPDLISHDTILIFSGTILIGLLSQIRYIIKK